MRTYVIVAEGDPELAAIMTETLSSCDYEVRSFLDFDEALAEMAARVPEVLIVAHEFSQCRGTELCTRVCEARGKSETPSIIFLAGARQKELPSLSARADLLLRKPLDPVSLESALEVLLRRKTRYAPVNPLTRLPAASALNREIERRRAASDSFSICYFRFERDSAKAFRKKYGELRFARMVRLAARAVHECAAALQEEASFVAHSGTPDEPEFVALTSTATAKELCGKVSVEFTTLADTLYDRKEREEGMFIMTGEKGLRESFPLVTLEVEVSDQAPQTQASPSSASDPSSSVPDPPSR